MSAKPTPTPWVRDQYGNVKPEGLRDNVLVTGFSLSTGYHQDGLPEANSALIVRAVNSHEAMVGALKTALEALEDIQFDRFDIDMDAVGIAVGSVEAAIALAKGE